MDLLLNPLFDLIGGYHLQLVLLLLFLGIFQFQVTLFFLKLKLISLLLEVPFFLYVLRKYFIGFEGDVFYLLLSGFFTLHDILLPV